MARSTRAAALTALLLTLAPAAARAQRQGIVAPRWRLELGAALPGATYAEDGAGGTVKGGFAPALGAAASWKAGARGSAELGVRASRASVAVETGGAERDAGAALQLDLVAALGAAIGERVTLRAGGGLSMLRGDDAIAPFRDGNASPWHLAGEAGVLVRLSRTWPLGVALTGHFMRLGAATIGDPVQEGTLTRLLLGVTHGF